MKVVSASRASSARVVRAHSSVSTKGREKKVANVLRLEDLPVENGLPFVGIDTMSPGYDINVLFDKHGPDCNAIRMRMFGHEHLALRSTEDLRQVLTDPDLDVKWPEAVQRLNPAFAKPPAEDRVWRAALKQIISPEQIGRAQLPLAVNKFTTQLSRHVEAGKPINLVEACKRMTSSVISATIVGDIFSEEEDDFLHPRYTKLGVGTFSPDFTVKGGLPFTPYKAGYDASQEITDFLVAKLEPLLQDPDSLPPSSLLRNLIQFLEHTDFDLSDSRAAATKVAREIMSLNMAGTDTTANTLAKCIQLIAAHPEWLQVLWEEQERLIAEFGPTLDRRVVSRSAVAMAVVQEVLRLRPPSTVAFRIALRDTVAGGVAIPEGYRVAACLRKEMKATGSGSDSFDPQHWLSDDRTSVTLNTSRGNNVFGGGRRKCPGMSLALTESTIFVAVLARCASAIHMSPSDMQQDLTLAPLPSDPLATFTPRS